MRRSAQVVPELWDKKSPGEGNWCPGAGFWCVSEKMEDDSEEQSRRGAQLRRSAAAVQPADACFVLVSDQVHLWALFSS